MKDMNKFKFVIPILILLFLGSPINIFAASHTSRFNNCLNSIRNFFNNDKKLFWDIQKFDFEKFKKKKNELLPLFKDASSSSFLKNLIDSKFELDLEGKMALLDVIIPFEKVLFSSIEVKLKDEKMIFLKKLSPHISLLDFSKGVTTYQLKEFSKVLYLAQANDPQKLVYFLKKLGVIHLDDLFYKKMCLDFFYFGLEKSFLQDFYHKNKFTDSILLFLKLKRLPLRLGKLFVSLFSILSEGTPFLGLKNKKVSPEILKKIYEEGYIKNKAELYKELEFSGKSDLVSLYTGHIFFLGGLTSLAYWLYEKTYNNSNYSDEELFNKTEKMLLNIILEESLLLEIQEGHLKDEYSEIKTFKDSFRKLLRENQVSELELNEKFFQFKENRKALAQNLLAKTNVKSYQEKEESQELQEKKNYTFLLNAFSALLLSAEENSSYKDLKDEILHKKIIEFLMKKEDKELIRIINETEGHQEILLKIFS